MNNKPGMNSQQIELYKRIQAFSFDQPDAALCFSKRLAMENGWSFDYAIRVVEEYKKFVFLAVAAEHPVTPSDQVDQVWHLHLSYTRSYWQAFCPKVLQTPLHHEPTRGGSLEQLKFNDWYSKTLESYVQFFGQIPPMEIWPNLEDRFDRDLHFVRVNTQQNWVVPKPWFNCFPSVQPKRTVVLLLLFTLTSVVSGCQIASKIPNPLNFTGEEFLTFYCLLSLGVIFIIFLFRDSLRQSNNSLRELVSLNPYETAYLAERKNRVVDTAIASLVQQGYVTVEPIQRVLIMTGFPREVSNPVERAVAGAIAVYGQIDRIRSSSSVMTATTLIQDRLRQLGLLVSQAQAHKAQLYPAILIGALLGLGTAKILVGISRDKPVGFLVMLCFIVAIIGLGFSHFPIHRSHYGDRVLNDLQNRARLQAMPHNCLDSQLPLPFALFGTTVLTSESLANLRQVLAPISTSGSFGGDGGSGDGGGGGSGCGGCGGCGGG